MSRRMPSGLMAVSPATRGAGSLLAVTAAWGSTFVLVKDLLQRLPVADFLAVRFAIAALVLALARPSAARRLSPRHRGRAGALGAVFAAAQIVQTIGLRTTSASVSGFVTGMHVVFTPLLLAVLLRRRVGAAGWLAVLLAGCGLGVLALRGLSLGGGELLTLLAALLYAAHIVGLSRWSDARNSYELTVVQMVVVAAVCLAFAAPGGIVLPSGPQAWAAVLFTSLVAGAVAVLVQTWAQAHLAPTSTAVVLSMEPLFAAGFAVTVGAEPATWRMLVGGAVMLAAMLVVALRPGRLGVRGVSRPTGPAVPSPLATRPGGTAPTAWRSVRV